MVSEDVKAYVSSLADLTFNSKPLINMLTMLADDYVAHAAEIVEVVENHLAKVKTDVKLPILYLIDCIVKNVGGPYTELFSHNIVATFCSVFRVVDEKTRAEMFKLRQTWNEVFSAKKLYAIDVQISLLDPAWPVTAPPPNSSIHLNPKFLKGTNPPNRAVKSQAVATTPPAVVPNPITLNMQQQLIQKQKELIELQQKKVELELLQTKVKLREQISSGATQGNVPQNILLKPEVAKQILSSNDKTVTNETSKCAPTAAPPTRIAVENVKPLNNIKIQKGQTPHSGGSRIQPANSALIAAAVNRPIRDPRLLRQQQKQHQNTSIVNVQLENKNSLEAPNKSVNKTNDPRLKNSDNVPSQKFTDINKPKQRISHKARLEHNKGQNNSTRIKSQSDDSKSSKNSSSSSLDSPKKSNLDKSPSKSPSGRSRRKEDSSSSRSSSTKIKARTSKSDCVLSTQKESKVDKGYTRRGMSPQFSPEPQDVDLRMSDKVASQKDVDLRQMPNALINKKRSSVDSLDDGASKKTKTKVFEVLFGSEDTDLRKLPSNATVERPPTPPPPIISTTEEKEPFAEVPPKSDLEAVRAKLANLKKNVPRTAKRKYDEENNQTVSTPSKILISESDGDKIKEGAMTSMQQKELMNKIIAQIEVQKLNEAKQMNRDDQPASISDEEVVQSSCINFGDKDERIMPPMNVGPLPPEDGYGKRFRRGAAGGGPPPNRRGGPRGRRNWEENRGRAPMRPWIGGNWPNDRRSPEVEMIVESVVQDDIKSITIDGLPRDIRHYDEVAVIFMNWDDPREISFQDGSRRVLFNDVDVYVLNFNEPYRDCRIGDTYHQVRLGAPGREIYIDYKPYECFFGGPSITIDLNGKMVNVQLDGPRPQVKIGDCRSDLVAGKIKLIIDAKYIVPVFLDAKLQTFTYDGQTHTLQLERGLKTVLIDDERYNVEFGGLPKPVTLNGKKHFARFSLLPKGLKPGNVRIKGLETNLTDVMEESLDVNEPALPITKRAAKSYEPNLSPDNSSSSNIFQNVLQQQSLHNLDFLTNVIPSSTNNQGNDSGAYQVDTNTITQSTESAPSVGSAFNLNSVTDLFQRLVATGMLSTTTSTPPALPAKEATPPNPIVANPIRHRYHNPRQHKKYPPLKPVSFAKPEQLKIRQGGLYEKLYSGMQCSSCGMRFPPEQSMYYSQHLDWHFRQNRKGKKSTRVASSRRWYYSIGDWQNYEEIEDLEERGKNYFDQQQQSEGTNDAQAAEVDIPSVTADPELQDICEMCGDKFEVFFHEDKEEWHFKNAVLADGKVYHPLCHEEHQEALLREAEEEQSKAKSEITNSLIPGIEIVLDDDTEVEKIDEDNNNEEVIVDESDDSKIESNEDEKKENGEAATNQDVPEYEEADDDVIIKEDTIEQIVLDDDDDEDEDIDDDLTEAPGPSENASPASVAVASPAPKEPIFDDGFVDVNEGLLMLKNPIKVKTEPMDEDELPEEQSFETSIAEDPEPPIQELPEEPKEPELEQLPSAFVPSIDGNLEIESGVKQPVTNVGGKIKINILKQLPAVPVKETNREIENDFVSETVIDPSQPLPPGEEPILLKLKPALQGVNLKKLPTVQKGSELTGMCSIM